MGEAPGQITKLLARFGKGDPAVDSELAELIYDDLRRQARRLFRSGNTPTIQPTSLVHEAFERLVKVEVDWNDRTHFFALSARLMKRLLINHVSAGRAQKRGGAAVRVTLNEQALADTSDTGLIELTDALDALATKDARKAELVELKYFGGLSLSEISAATGLSEATVGRDLRFARAWLKDRLTQHR